MNSLSPAKKLVLYADDDVDDLNLVKEAFKEHAANVELKTALDGTEAIDLINTLVNKNKLPCLIILDINMPRLNGKETLLKIREINKLKETPVILFTTSSNPADRTFAKENRAEFITKPIEFKQMDNIINTFINACGDEIGKELFQK